VEPAMNPGEDIKVEKITLEDLSFQESQVLRQTEADFPGYFRVAKKGIDLYWEFIHQLLEEIAKSDKKIEHYAYLQLYKNAYTIKSVYNTINLGYYFDSMILLRPALESIVTTLFLSRNPQHLDLAITEPKKFQDKFSIKKRFENINYTGGYGDFQNLCRFSHPSILNIIAMFSSRTEMDFFPYGISYNEQNASLCIYLFTRHLGMLLDCMQYVFRSRLQLKNPDLLSRYKDYLKELEMIAGEFRQRLTKFRDQYLKLYNVKV
jgi:hypothetical protein